MSTSSVEHPPAHTLRGWVLDVSVALAVGALSLPSLLREGRSPSFAAVTLLVLLTVPVLARRRHPVPVFGWSLVVTVVGAVVVDQELVSLAVLVALYTVAAQRSRREALVCAAVLEVATVVAAVRSTEIDWWFALLTLSGMVAAALGLGLFSATRRAYLAELRDRADRLERERDQQGELAAAAERARIAREIHDIVAHHLTVMVALSDGAVAAAASSPERATDVMRTVSATGRQALTDTRRLLGVLREDTGADDDLHPAPHLAELDELVARVRSAGLPVSYEVTGLADAVPSGVQLTVYRLVQEALTNTLKHAGPGARATVRLGYRPTELTLEVTDDGLGQGVPAGTGRGLVGMRERVQAFGGEVSAGPRRSGGWVVAARLALSADAPAGSPVGAP